MAAIPGCFFTDFSKDRDADQVHDPVVEAVRADLLMRSSLGVKKYGKTLDRTDLTLRDWLQHTYEETLDTANYLKRAILECDANVNVNVIVPGKKS